MLNIIRFSSTPTAKVPVECLKPAVEKKAAFPLMVPQAADSVTIKCQ